MFRNEAAVWQHMRTHIIGDGWWWQRVEAVQPDGMPDVLGMRGRRTVWIELKKGEPRLSKLRPAQRRWLTTAWRQGAEAFLVFGSAGGLRWFQSLTLTDPVEPPDFFRREKTCTASRPVS